MDLNKPLTHVQDMDEILHLEAQELSTKFHDQNMNWHVHENLTLRHAWFLMNCWIQAEVGDSSYRCAVLALIAVVQVPMYGE